MKKIAMILIAIAALGVIGYASYLNLINNKTNVVPSPTPTINIDSTIETENIEEYPETWEKYRSSTLGISFYYDQEMELKENSNDPNEPLRLVLIGPTQSLGTEVYDGLILIFNSGTYEGDFGDFVTEEHLKNKNEPSTNEIGEVIGTGLGNLTGYEFTVSSLGEFTHYYFRDIDLKDNRYVKISTLVADPEELGYDEILEKILTSIEFN